MIKNDKLIDIGIILSGSVLLYVFLFDAKKVYGSVSIIILCILFLMKKNKNKDGGLYNEVVHPQENKKSTG